MRILFVTSSRIGDAVLSTGLLDHLIRTYPDPRITVACGPVAEGVFLRMPCLERLVLVEKRPYGRHWLGLWAGAVGHRWDLVVDIRASALGWLVPARRRAVMRKRPGHKTAQLGAILGLDPPPLPVAWTAPEDRARAAALLPPGAPVLALGPTANWRGKVWPRGAVRRADAGPARRADGRRARGRAGRAGRGGTRPRRPGAGGAAGGDRPRRAGLTLPEAASVLARAALFVGNDSGLMHLAAAAGAPTLGLFGPTPAAEYAPAGPRAAVAVAPGARMEDLSVAAALAAAAGLIGLARAA